MTSLRSRSEFEDANALAAPSTGGGAERIPQLSHLLEGSASAGGAAPVGHCLVSRDGRIQALDSGALTWVAGGVRGQKLGELVEADQLAAALAAVFAGIAPKELVGELVGWTPAGADQLAVSVRLELLVGPESPLILATIRPLEPAPPTVSLDALTRLPDRRAIADRIDCWQRTASAAVLRFAVLFLDLNDFKSINDSHGHAVGDAVLQALSGRWLGCVRDGDLVARYGGDEFVILLANADTDDEVEPVVHRLMDATKQPVPVGKLELRTSATIGWTAPAGTEWSIESLIAEADRRMYDQKSAARRNVRESPMP